MGSQGAIFILAGAAPPSGGYARPYTLARDAPFVNAVPGGALPYNADSMRTANGRPYTRTPERSSAGGRAKQRTGSPCRQNRTL